MCNWKWDKTGEQAVGGFSGGREERMTLGSGLPGCLEVEVQLKGIWPGI